MTYKKRKKGIVLLADGTIFYGKKIDYGDNSNITKITKYLNKNNIKYQIIFPYHYNKPYIKINLNN